MLTVASTIVVFLKTPRCIWTQAGVGNWQPGTVAHFVKNHDTTRTASRARSSSAAFVNRYQNSLCMRQVFRYVPLSTQLSARFHASGFAESIRLKLHQRADGIVADLHDSPGWREAVLQNGDFANEPRNLVLSVYADGVNPWSKDTQYSMWPIVLTVRRDWVLPCTHNACMQIENLAPALRTQYENMLLWGVVPGEFSTLDPRTPKERRSPKSLAPYFDKLVDEFSELWNGVDVIDYSQPEGGLDRRFRLRAMLLMARADYPGKLCTFASKCPCALVCSICQD
jgi:hypothetical protein